MRGEDSFVLWTCKRRSVTSKVETQEENKTHKGGNGLWVAASIRYMHQMRPQPSGIQAFKSIDLDQQQEGRKKCSQFVEVGKRDPVVLNKRVWEFFFADCYGGLPTEKCLVPSSSKGVFLSPLSHTSHPCRGVQSQVRWGRRDSFSKASKWLQPPHLPLSQAATEKLLWREDMGGCRSSRAQPCREPECQHVMNILSPVTSLHRRGEGNQASKGGRQERPEFPGAAAPQCLSSSKRRAKVFALGIIIKDIGSCFHMPSSPLFFLINCKPHPGC